MDSQPLSRIFQPYATRTLGTFHRIISEGCREHAICCLLATRKVISIYDRLRKQSWHLSLTGTRTCPKGNTVSQRVSTTRTNPIPGERSSCITISWNVVSLPQITITSPTQTHQSELKSKLWCTCKWKHTKKTKNVFQIVFTYIY